MLSIRFEKIYRNQGSGGYYFSYLAITHNRKTVDTYGVGESVPIVSFKEKSARAGTWCHFGDGNHCNIVSIIPSPIVSQIHKRTPSHFLIYFSWMKIWFFLMVIVSKRCFVSSLPALYFCSFAGKSSHGTRGTRRRKSGNFLTVPMSFETQCAAQKCKKIFTWIILFIYSF